MFAKNNIFSSLKVALPNKKKRGIMKYIWRTFYYIFKSLAFVVEMAIFLLAKLKDGLCFMKDWFSERELLG